jgi:hypothetical protein
MALYIKGDSMYYKVRFKANLDDYRPIKWPPPGPYWCTGYSEAHSVVVAYVRTLEQIIEFWPEAEDIDSETDPEEIKFSDRFRKPEWWDSQVVLKENSSGS